MKMCKLFIMSDNKDTILEQLHQLGLTHDEAKIYVELLHEPNTHLRLSVITGINRTKVYRLVENLEKRSLVAKRTDDRGTFWVAADPGTLEIAVVTEEKKVRSQRQVLSQLLPSLESFKSRDKSAFVVRTYEGLEGLKQMVWHELKAKGEMLTFGGQTIEDLITDHYWAEKHRALTIEAGYTLREILNPDIDRPTFTNNETFMRYHYQYRQLPSSVVHFNEQTVIYNDTVSIYHWREDQKVGVEIISKTYANMMRKVFEYYWQIAKEGK
jgi:sugar-specific transcriptional regulator TrmB